MYDSEKYKLEEVFRCDRKGIEYVSVTRGPDGIELTTTVHTMVRFQEPLVFGSVYVEPEVMKIGVSDFLMALDTARDHRLRYLIEPTLERMYAKELMRKHDLDDFRKQPSFTERFEAAAAGKGVREKASVEDLTMQIMDATRKNPDEFKSDLRSIRELYDWAVETDKSFNAKL